MKHYSFVLLVSVALLGNASAREAPEGRPYEVTVEDLLQCVMVDGDLLWSPSDYRRIVASHLNTKRSILVSRGRGVRQVCWLEAVRSLRKAGFSDIRPAPAKSR